MADPVLLSLSVAEAALAPLILAMRRKGDLDEVAVARLLESIPPAQSVATLIGFVWALITRLKEEWEEASPTPGSMSRSTLFAAGPDGEMHAVKHYSNSERERDEARHLARALLQVLESLTAGPVDAGAGVGAWLRAEAAAAREAMKDWEEEKR